MGQSFKHMSLWRPHLLTPAQPPFNLFPLFSQTSCLSLSCLLSLSSKQNTLQRISLKSGLTQPCLGGSAILPGRAASCEYGQLAFLPSLYPLPWASHPCWETTFAQITSDAAKCNGSCLPEQSPGSSWLLPACGASFLGFLGPAVLRHTHTLSKPAPSVCV